jgi:hypothetical protein
VTATEYGFSPDRKGQVQFSTKSTDANGKQSEQFTDARGQGDFVKAITPRKATCGRVLPTAP